MLSEQAQHCGECMNLFRHIHDVCVNVYLCDLSFSEKEIMEAEVAGAPNQGWHVDGDGDVTTLPSEGEKQVRDTETGGTVVDILRCIVLGLVLTLIN